MKRLSTTLSTTLALLLAVSVSAQENSTIKGTLSIDYRTRSQATEAGIPPGVSDTYKVDLTVANLVGYKGTITHQPTIISSVLGRETQAGQVSYDLDAIVFNPANSLQQKSVGKLVGAVPIDRTGTYLFDKGNLRVAVETIGKVEGFVSPFAGRAAGKPPTDDSIVSQARKAAVQIQRQVNGRAVALAVTNYDLMNSTALVLPAGPLKVYPAVTVNGATLYDYDRDVWFFDKMTMQYAVDGIAKTDTVGGSIRWVEDPNRASNGLGRYEFDVRLNVPVNPQGEAAVFEETGDESAFFAEPDATMQSLTGTASYKDTMAGEDVIGSTVTIDLKGNNLNKQQLMALTKLLWLVDVVPMNAE